MTKFATALSVVGGLAAIILVGVAVGWIGSRESASQAPPSPSPEPSSPAPLKFAKSRPEAPDTPVLAKSDSPPVAASNALITDWEDRLDTILAAEGTESDKAKQLLEIFQRLPENGQVEVAQHLSNLLADQDYTPLGNLLTNSALPEGVLDVLMADLLNRPNSVKLPMILEVARDQQHPKATEAKDLLELFLEDNFDQDWSKWQARMDQWLKDNPD